MSRLKESRVPRPRISLGLNLEQGVELGRGDTICQRQQNYRTLSNEVAQILSDLREVLPRLKEYQGGRARDLRHQRDDKKFNARNFDGSVNPNSYLKWVQSIESFFHVKEYRDEKDFKAAIHKLESDALFGYETAKK